MLIVSILNLVIIEDKGSVQQKLYLEILKKEFNENRKYSLEEVTEKLRKIEAENIQDRVTKIFAYTDNVRNAVYGREYLNNFAVEYINLFYNLEKQDTVYTEYSKNKQISILKIDTENGNAFVGIGFRVFTTSLSTDIFMLLRNNNDICKYIYMVYGIYSRNRYIKSYKWYEEYIKSKR